MKFKSRCVENEKYINLQISHPLYADMEARTRILASCVQWEVCRVYGQGDNSWIILEPAIWKVANKYCEFMGHDKVLNTEKPANVRDYYIPLFINHRYRSSGCMGFDNEDA